MALRVRIEKMYFMLENNTVSQLFWPKPFYSGGRVMPDNVGEMFYYGSQPWHGKGKSLPSPATAREAILAGGLDWSVEFAPLQTAENLPSPVKTRMAIVRTDREPGDPRRVLGITHKGFRPLQNRDAIEIFDAIFGKGKPVYHTGGYLGNGEVVWLLADLNRGMSIHGDLVETYVLFANSHDGSRAINFRLTTVRVVCQNTLAIAMRDKDIAAPFNKAHQGSYDDLKSEVEAFFKSTLKFVDDLEEKFKAMDSTECTPKEFQHFLERLVPFPSRPVNQDPRVQKAFQTRAARIKETRLGMENVWKMSPNLDGVRKTKWGALNAVTEYVDHKMPIKGDRYTVNLLGSGASLKERAHNLLATAQ